MVQGLSKRKAIYQNVGEKKSLPVECEAAPERRERARWAPYCEAGGTCSLFGASLETDWLEPLECGSRRIGGHRTDAGDLAGAKRALSAACDPRARQTLAFPANHSVPVYLRLGNGKRTDFS